MGPIRAIVLSGDPLVADKLASVIVSGGAAEVVKVCEAAAALAMLGEREFHAIIMDGVSLRRQLIDTIETLKKGHPHLGIVVRGKRPRGVRPDYQRVAYLPATASDAQLVVALETVVLGATPHHLLTAREQQIHDLRCDGGTNSQIAKQLKISDSYVQQCITSINKKRGRQSPEEWALFYR